MDDYDIVIDKKANFIEFNWIENICFEECMFVENTFKVRVKVRIDWNFEKISMIVKV